MSSPNTDAIPPRSRPSSPTPTGTFGGMMPFLPPPPAQVNTAVPGLVRPVTFSLATRSAVHFLVHEGMPELRAAAKALGWLDRGWTTLSVRWQELVYSTDRWATARSLRSSDVPCPVMSGHFFLPGIPPHTDVWFAVHVGFGCHAPTDLAGVRAESDLWFNDHGRNYRQWSK